MPIATALPKPQGCAEASPHPQRRSVLVPPASSVVSPVALLRPVLDRRLGVCEQVAEPEPIYQRASDVRTQDVSMSDQGSAVLPKGAQLRDAYMSSSISTCSSAFVCCMMRSA